MSLQITQGPLPNDGDTVAADQFLEQWVSGTTIRGIGIDNFVSSLSFVISSTSAPAGDRRGLFWFKRGEGTLYLREEADRCDTRYTNSLNDAWIGIAPIRTIWVEVQSGGRVGGAAHLGEKNTGEGAAAALSAYFEDCKGKRIPFYRSSMTLVPGPTKIGMHVGIIQDTTYSGAPVPVIEWGFTRAAIATGGSNVARGAFAKLRYTDPNQEVTAFHPRTTAWTNETSYGNIGIICETNATTNTHLALIFKRPGVDYAWKMSY